MVRIWIYSETVDVDVFIYLSILFFSGLFQGKDAADKLLDLLECENIHHQNG